MSRMGLEPTISCKMVMSPAIKQLMAHGTNWKVQPLFSNISYNHVELVVLLRIHFHNK